MQEIIDFLRTDNFLLMLSIMVGILTIGFISILYSNIKLKNKYNKFMKKIGNGKNIEEDLENYMYRVERVERQNAEIISYCKNLDDEVAKCIQKVGIVRYSAFKDTGSDLSFAVAMLDENNDGVVFNGIYSREMSNIYAKPVKKGVSEYTLSEEEKEAIRRAIEVNNLINVK
ncbi:DUF4446 family protein [bacterium]|nr:DUF4446 family protein [bacterium]